MVDRLLAKSVKGRVTRSATLPGHVTDTLDAVEALLAVTADMTIEQLRLGPEWREPYRRAAMLGTFLHDLGKANDGFQRMLGGERGAQPVRHETLSLLLAAQLLPLRDWLMPFTEIGPLAPTVWSAALWAAGGHHLKLDKAREEPFPRGAFGSEVRLLISHDDFAELLSLGPARLGLASAPTFRTDLRWGCLESDGDGVPARLLRFVNSEARPALRGLSPEGVRFVAAVKAAVLAADVAGSALPRAGAHIAKWVTSALERSAQTAELDRIVSERLDGCRPRNFQEQVAASSSRVTLVTAGCGSGKTAAAYLWAARRATGRKVFVCYPTTGTASEGFKDYPHAARSEAALIHSRAAVDLEDLLETPETADDTAKRLESLQAWEPPLIVCTAHTVLGLVQNYRRPLFAWPAIARGAFIFDEIHAYDRGLFAALLRFLDAIRGAPTLLMTASLPDARRAAIEDVTGSLPEIRGPQEWEQLPRYRIREGADAESCWEQITRCISVGGKILWVCNTVDRAITAYQEALARNIRSLPYHSRYRYEDRVRRHADVIDAFKPGNQEPLIAVTTQVAEMSLDLSADLLVTELAPAPAMIQRLGRLNRRATPEKPGSPAPALVVDPSTPLPYASRDLDTAREWVDHLAHEPSAVSQADLARALCDTQREEEQILPAPSAWIDGGWASVTAELSDFETTVPVLLERDLPRVEAAADARAEAIRCAVPIPLRRDVFAWRRWRYLWIAPENRVAYDELRGAAWRS